MIKRKKRKKIEVQAIDFSKPLDLTIFGTPQDPCFGKHYSPEATECGMCGDSQVCAIILSQSLHAKRNQLAKTQAFMDIEEQDLIKEELVDKFIRKLLKMEGGRIAWDKCINRLERRFNADNKLQKRTLLSITQKIVMKAKDLALVKSKESGERFIKLK